MRRVEVEARDDAGHPEGGHAFILVQGLEHLDDGVTFFLRPLDAVALDDGIGNLEHEQRATAVRSVPGGVELLVGPDVTEHQALQPGCSVEIEIPEAGVWSEFEWPEVTTRARPKRAKIVVNRPPDAEAVDEPGRVGRTAVERDQPAGSDVPRAGDTPPAPSRPATSPAEARMTGSVQKEATAMVTQQRADKVAGPDVESVGRDPHPEHGQSADDYVVFYPHARGGKIGPGGAGNAPQRKAASLLPTSRLGAAAMAVAGVLAVQGLLWLGSGGTLSSQASPSAASGTAGADGSNYDLFSVGPVSPRGVQARDMNATKALENAQAALLTPGGTRDAEEASYWLRRFITSGGSDERTRRVLTQLGTTFADGASRQPEFGKARQVWELASSFGDPVAMCFLGTLHENGLGVTPDRKVALQWYERAKLTGGCPAVDEAIARVKK